MSKLLKASALAASVVLVTGCAMARSPVGNGGLFTDVKGSESAGAANSGYKSGSSCAVNILGLVAYGDASAHTAASNGGVGKIHSVDYKTNTILGVWARTCTIVYGE